MPACTPLEQAVIFRFELWGREEVVLERVLVGKEDGRPGVHHRDVRKQFSPLHRDGAHLVAWRSRLRRRPAAPAFEKDYRVADVAPPVATSFLESNGAADGG